MSQVAFNFVDASMRQIRNRPEESCSVDRALWCEYYQMAVAETWRLLFEVLDMEERGIQERIIAVAGITVLERKAGLLILPVNCLFQCQ